MFSVKVMSYNIQGHAAARRPDHIPKIAEVITGGAGRRRAAGSSLQDARVGRGPGGAARGADGLQTRVRPQLLDRWRRLRQCRPVAARDQVDARASAAGSGEPRSLLQTDIVASGVELSFFVTHLAAWGRLLRVARLRQITELGDIIARGSLPHILCGDFNVPPGAEEMSLLLSRGHLRICGEPGEATFPMTRQRLDYVMCDARWEFVSARSHSTRPSDYWRPSPLRRRAECVPFGAVREGSCGPGRIWRLGFRGAEYLSRLWRSSAASPAAFAFVGRGAFEHRHYGGCLAGACRANIEEAGSVAFAAGC